jgi:hypothetical protein
MGTNMVGLVYRMRKIGGGLSVLAPMQGMQAASIQRPRLPFAWMRSGAGMVRAGRNYPEAVHVKIVAVSLYT